MENIDNLRSRLASARKDIIGLPEYTGKIIKRAEWTNSQLSANLLYTWENSLNEILFQLQKNKAIDPKIIPAIMAGINSLEKQFNNFQDSIIQLIQRIEDIANEIARLLIQMETKTV